MQKPPVPMLPNEEAERRAKDQQMQERFAELSVFRILLNQPSLAREIASTLTTLLFEDNVLDPRLRELLTVSYTHLRAHET